MGPLLLCEPDRRRGRAGASVPRCRLDGGGAAAGARGFTRWDSGSRRGARCGYWVPRSLGGHKRCGDSCPRPAEARRGGQLGDLRARPSPNSRPRHLPSLSGTSRGALEHFLGADPLRRRVDDVLWRCAASQIRKCDRQVDALGVATSQWQLPWPQRTGGSDRTYGCFGQAASAAVMGIRGQGYHPSRQRIPPSLRRGAAYPVPIRSSRSASSLEYR